MRKLVVVLALVVGMALPQAASATQHGSDPNQNQISQLLQQLGISLVSRARAAECTEEGETCSSNEQCCAGLECSGGPPATCAPED
jgi:Conotoxin